MDDARCSSGGIGLLIALVISELMPFIKATKYHGLFHAVINIIKSISLAPTPPATPPASRRPVPPRTDDYVRPDNAGNDG
jgi:hypothetical protein